MQDIYTDYTNYIESILTDDINKWTFKSHPDYCFVLEHVSKEEGNSYMFEIENRFNLIYSANKQFLIELCHENDLYGNPKKYSFSNFTSCSPTNLRYILHSLLILTYMKECMLNNINIIEIGGGYGGLCFFMYKLSHLFNITISTYSMFDLPNPLLLQQKYLEKKNIYNVNYLELDYIKNIKENSFLISNYAFTEISFDLQKKYTSQLLNQYVSHGFLAWNAVEVYEFIENKIITSETEFPLTHSLNKFVRFKPNNKIA